MFFTCLYFASEEMYCAWPTKEVFEVDRMFIALFCILFGAFTAGQAMQFGPDISAAKQAASRVFSYIEEPSKINPDGEDQKDLPAIKDETFRGEIEFKDVWFRYSSPSSQHRWVFKGLNLKISAN